MPIIEQEEIVLQAEAMILSSKGEEAVQEKRNKLREVIESKIPRSTLQSNQQVPQEEEDGPKFKSFDEFELYAQTVFAGIGE